MLDVTTGIEHSVLAGDRVVDAVAFSPNGKIVATGLDDGSIHLRDLATGRALLTIQNEERSRSLAFSPDGKTLAGEAPEGIQLWNASSGAPVRTLKDEDNGGKTSLGFSPDGRFLASNGGVWEVSTGSFVHPFRSSSASVETVAFSPDGRSLAAGSTHDTLRVWDLVSKQGGQRAWAPSDMANSVAFTADGRSLALGSWHGVRRWDLGSGKAMPAPPEMDERNIVWSVAYSPDGRWFAAASDYDRAVHLWEVSTGKPGPKLAGPSDVVAVAFSPDSKTLAGASHDKSAKLWDLSTGTVVQTLAGHSEELTAVAFSPDGKKLATASRDNTARLWEVVTGSLLRVLGGHRNGVQSVAFSPDGKKLATGTLDGTVELWDVDSGKSINAYTEAKGGVSSVAFSPDGKLVVAGGGDGSTRLSDPTSGARLATLRSVRGLDAGYVFTAEGWIDFVGAEAEKAQAAVSCRAGSARFPFELCKERFLVPGLLAKVLARETIEP